MSAPHPAARENFFKIALEYYVNGRAAALSGCLFTTGNLLHHAVEMMLKGELSKTTSLDDLANPKKFGHWLPKCWNGIKALFPTVDLTEFDAMIQGLDKFEQIRYPDKLLSHGASIGIGFGRGRVIQNIKIDHPVPEYQVGIGDVDAFFARGMNLCHMNPVAYFSFLTEQGREILKKYNDFAKDWLS
jgi:hypothetical protein